MIDPRESLGGEKGGGGGGGCGKRLNKLRQQQQQTDPRQWRTARGGVGKGRGGGGDGLDGLGLQKGGSGNRAPLDRLQEKRASKTGSSRIAGGDRWGKDSDVSEDDVDEPDSGGVYPGRRSGSAGGSSGASCGGGKGKGRAPQPRVKQKGGGAGGKKQQPEVIDIVDSDDEEEGDDGLGRSASSDEGGAGFRASGISSRQGKVRWMDGFGRGGIGLV